MRTLERLLPDDGGVWGTLNDGSRMCLDLKVPLESAVFWSGRFDDVAVRELTGRMTERGAVALDVGANIGLMSVPLATRAAELDGHVFAFEPMPGSQSRLSENVAANGLQDVVTCVPVALGRDHGAAEIEAIEDRPTGNAMRVASRTPRSFSVGLRRLDDVAKELGIARCDVVKVDVEGGELDVLMGGESFLRKHRPVIYAELNAIHMARVGWSDGDLLTLVAGWDYRALIQTDRGFESFRERSGLMDNVLLVP